MRYVKSKVDVTDKEEAYRVYMSDCMKVLSGVNVRFVDVAYGKKDAEDVDKDEVIHSLKDKLNAIAGRG